jgi:hypothetical protein
VGCRDLVGEAKILVGLATQPWIILRSVTLNPWTITTNRKVYALQFIDHWQGPPSADEQGNSFSCWRRRMITMHLWEVDARKSPNRTTARRNESPSREVMSLRFTDMHDSGYGVHTGKVGVGYFGVRQSKKRRRSKQQHRDRASQSTQVWRRPESHNLVYVFDALPTALSMVYWA